MRTRIASFLVAWLLVPIAISEGNTLSVTPTDALSTVREKLAADASIWLHEIIRWTQKAQ